MTTCFSPIPSLSSHPSSRVHPPVPHPREERVYHSSQPSFSFQPPMSLWNEGCVGKPLPGPDRPLHAAMCLAKVMLPWSLYLNWNIEMQERNVAIPKRKSIKNLTFDQRTDLDRYMLALIFVCLTLSTLSTLPNAGLQRLRKSVAANE